MSEFIGRTFNYKELLWTVVSYDETRRFPYQCEADEGRWHWPMTAEILEKFLTLPPHLYPSIERMHYDIVRHGHVTSAQPAPASEPTAAGDVEFESFINSIGGSSPKPTVAWEQRYAILKAELEQTRGNEVVYIATLGIIAAWLRGTDGFTAADGFTAQSIYDMVAKDIGLEAASAGWIDALAARLRTAEDARERAENNYRSLNEITGDTYNEIWEMVGDGKGEWDYPAQIVRYVGYMKEKLEKLQAAADALAGDVGEEG